MVRGQWAPHDRHGTTMSLPLIHFFFSRSDRQSRLPSDLLSVTRVEAPPPSTRLEGDLVTAARRHGGGQRPHRHARGPHGKYIISLLPYGPRSKADPLTMDFSVFAAHQPGHRATVRHLHPCHHGVGEVHLRPRDIPAEQRRHHRHGHAHAAAPTPHHRRLRPHEPKRQDPSAQRYPDLPLARISPTPSRPGGSPGITPTPLAYLND
jgi:hypothetical protein